MKRILTAIAGALILVGCGVGNYSISSGKSDKAAISFTTDTKNPVAVTVTVDGTSYNVQTVKDKAYRTDRRIKETAQNTIYLEKGQHAVTVTSNGEQVYSKTLFLSAAEHRIIEL